MNALRPYYNDNWNLLLCPEAARIVESLLSESGAFRAWYREVDLPAGGEYRYVSSYGINSWTNYMTQDRGMRLEEWFWKNVNGITGKNNIPVFADSLWHDAWPMYTDTPPVFDDQTQLMTVSEMHHFCINRHNGAVNTLFMDFSARKTGLKELWTLKWHRSFNTEGPWTKTGGVQPGDWPEWMKNFKEF